MSNRRLFFRWFLQGCTGLVLVCLIGGASGGLYAPRSGERKLITHVTGAPYRIGFSTQVDSIFKPGQKLLARTERRNGYGSQVIALYLGAMPVGNIPQKDSAALSRVLDEGRPLEVTVVDVNADYPWEGVAIEVRWPV
jgi:hypothetical protein